MSPLFTRRIMERLLRSPRRQDPYRSQTKPRGTPQCPKCGAINLKGSWVPESQIPKDQIKQMKQSRRASLKCPACKQLEDHYAMGVVEIQGKSWKKDQELVQNTIYHTEEIARSKNDQQRILWTQSVRGKYKIYVTLPELARKIGKELERSFKGLVQYERSTEEPFLLVRWSSDLPSLGHIPGSPLKIKRSTSKLASVRRANKRGKSDAFRKRGKL